MKYVDEFRDRAKAGTLVREINALAGASAAIATVPSHHGGVRRPYPFDFRYGIEGMLPRRSSWCTGPAAWSASYPWAGSTRVAIAERDGVIFTTFGDAMRVPGSQKSLSQAKADGADIRMVYSPMDALAIARPTPSARWCSSASPSRPPCRRRRSPSLPPRPKG